MKFFNKKKSEPSITRAQSEVAGMDAVAQQRLSFADKPRRMSGSVSARVVSSPSSKHYYYYYSIYLFVVRWCLVFIIIYF
jgi:hypothetical protein